VSRAAKNPAVGASPAPKQVKVLTEQVTNHKHFTFSGSSLPALQIDMPERISVILLFANCEFHFWILSNGLLEWICSHLQWIVSVQMSANHEDSYTKQVTELKLSVDSLEKERDFYFAKLRDIEILCQAPELSHLPVVMAVQRILYAAEDTPSVIAEAQAMVADSAGHYNPHSNEQHHSSISDLGEMDDDDEGLLGSRDNDGPLFINMDDSSEGVKRDIHKRKSLLGLEYSELESSLSPPQRRLSSYRANNQALASHSMSIVASD
jgi:hypothetical protein